MSDCPPTVLALARLPFAQTDAGCHGCSDGALWTAGLLMNGRIVTVLCCDACADRLEEREGALPRIMYPPAASRRWISITDAAALLGLTYAGMYDWASRNGLARRTIAVGRRGHRGYVARVAVEAEARRRAGTTPSSRKSAVNRRLRDQRAAVVGDEWLPAWRAAEALGVNRESVRRWAIRHNVPRHDGCYWRAAVEAEVARRSKRAA